MKRKEKAAEEEKDDTNVPTGAKYRVKGYRLERGKAMMTTYTENIEPRSGRVDSTCTICTSPTPPTLMQVTKMES